MLRIISLIFLVLPLHLLGQKDAPLGELELQRDGKYYRINTIPPFTGTAYENFENGKKKSRVEFKDGKLDGKVTQWHDTGEKASIVHYSNGIKEGKEIQFYPTGGKKMELQYINDEVDGMILEWHENGQKLSEGIYKNGKAEGKHQWWFRLGKLDQAVDFKNGLPDGKIERWYRNGKKKLETQYQAGLKQGVNKEWYDNGQLKVESAFIADQEDGLAKFYSKKGYLLDERKFKKGTLIEHKNYRSGGIKAGKQHFIQVFNEKESFFVVDIKGEKFVRDRSAKIITYNVDGMLLQIHIRPIETIQTDATTNSKDVLLAFKSFEQKYIETETQSKINIELNQKSNSSGLEYLYWYFDSPSKNTQPQTPRTVQQEHYFSFVCNKQILSLYSVVTNSDDERKVLAMLKHIADGVSIKKDRIDLNALQNEVLKKK